MIIDNEGGFYGLPFIIFNLQPSTYNLQLLTFNLQLSTFNLSPMFNKLRTVVYHTTDLPAAKEWYIKITGIQPYFDEPFYVGFDINGCELGLDPDMTGVEKGNHSFVYWSVDQIEEKLAGLLKEGATLVSDVTSVGGPIKVAVVNDPWGNAVGLIEGA